MRPKLLVIALSLLVGLSIAHLIVWHRPQLVDPAHDPSVPVVPIKFSGGETLPAPDAPPLSFLPTTSPAPKAEKKERSSYRLPAPLSGLPETLTLAVTEEDGMNSIITRRYCLSKTGRLTLESRSLLNPGSQAPMINSLHFAPNGHYAYVVGGNSGPAILQYRVNADGTLSPLSPPTVLSGQPYAPFASASLISSPDGKNLYALCSDGIWQYSVADNGLLSPLATPRAYPLPVVLLPMQRKYLPPGPNGTRSYQFKQGNYLTTSSLAFAPNGKTAYVISSEYYFTGVQTLTSGPIAGGPNMMTENKVDIARDLIALHVGSNGALTPLGQPIPISRSRKSLQVDPNSRLIGVTGDAITLYRLAKNGAVISPIAARLPGNSVCFNEEGDRIYVSEERPSPRWKGASISTIISYRLAHNGLIYKTAEAVTLPTDYTRHFSMSLDRTGHFLCCLSDRIFIYRIRRDGLLSLTPTSKTPAFSFPGTTQWVAGRAAAPMALPPPPDHVRGQAAHEYAYVLNAGDGTISQYKISRTGALTPLSPATITAGLAQWPTSLISDPNGKYIYVSGDPNTAFHCYKVGTEGVLTSFTLKSVHYPVGHTFGAMVIDSTGRYLYATGDSPSGLSVFRILSDGSLHYLSQQPLQSVPWPGVMSLDSKLNIIGLIQGNGEFTSYGIGQGGKLSQLSQAQLNVNRPMTFSPSGYYGYAANEYDGVSQFTISANGVLTDHTPFTAPTDITPMWVKLTPNGQYAYSANKGDYYGDGSITEFQVKNNGTLKPLSSPTVLTGTSPFYDDVDPSGRFLYAISQGRDKNDNNPDRGSISEYYINQSGQLAPLAPVHVPTGRDPSAMVIVKN